PCTSLCCQRCSYSLGRLPRALRSRRSLGIRPIPVPPKNLPSPSRCPPLLLTQPQPPVLPPSRHRPTLRRLAHLQRSLLRQALPPLPSPQPRSKLVPRTAPAWSGSIRTPASITSPARATTARPSRANTCRKPTPSRPAIALPERISSRLQHSVFRRENSSSIARNLSFRLP